MDLRLGVPLLLAFIPQNVFYAINSDVLSPVSCGALFLCVLHWLRTATPSFLLGALTGLAMAAAYVTKLSTLPQIAVALIAIVANLGWRIRQLPRATFIAFAALVICSVIPIGSWIFWTKHQFGDLTGSTAKIALLGWTRKPFANWWQHPIFTPGGFWIFWSDLLASFWRGEVKWHGQILRCEFADGFYAISSVALLVAALIGLRRGTGLSTFQRQAISIAALSFIISVGFLALLSIQFDFGNCVNPSNAHPYFTSGRLLSGALIPFAVAYVYGIAYLFRRINSAVPVAVLALIIVFATTSEIVTNYGVFASEYNFFHI
jgi:hypothetical protein